MNGNRASSSSIPSPSPRCTTTSVAIVICSVVAAGFERDGALAGIAGREIDDDAGRAIETALGIADPNLRRDSLDRIVYSWFDRSPNEARAWLQNTADLPEDWKHEWLAGP